MENNARYIKYLASCVLFLFIASVILYDQRRNTDGSEYDPVLLPESPEKVSSERTNYRNLLCQLDKSRVENFKSLAKVDDAHILDRFHQFIQDPMSSFCKEMKKFGGHYSTKCKYTDGAKFVCMDDLLVDIQNNECLIYSFGIDKDWTFEDAMSFFGCKVYAHDPTVDFPKQRSKNVFFEKVGLASKFDKENNLKDLKSILAGNGHTNSKISYLKMDIEEYEIEGLSAWLNSGALDNVNQIGLEFHLNHGDVIKKTRTFIKALSDLYSKQNFGLISYEANNCYKNIDRSQTYFSLAEIVLKKQRKAQQCDSM